MQIRCSPRRPGHRAWVKGMLLAAATACLAGCNGEVQGIPKAHRTPEYTPSSWEFASEPAAVWNAVVAEMASQPGQKPLAQSSVDRLGSWSGELKGVKDWNDYACQAAQIRGFSSDGQMLTTAWVAKGQDKGSQLYLVRVFMCSETFEGVSPSRGDFERDMAQRIGKRLGETTPGIIAPEKAGQQ